MKIAIEGCAHGELENIYNTIASIEKRQKIKVDLLLCCGDFQSTRNVDDLDCMAVPKKYQDICTFYKYYSGEKVAPILTIFIGGNHEASNYLQELPYGGWVAPNIYYLGYAGVVNVNGIRIGGVSGIYKGFDYHKGHFEFAPYDNSTKRSVYHVRNLDVFRMKQLTPSVDIMLSHDWPRGCHNYGNAQQLLRFKPHFRQDIENNKLGSPPMEDLLKTLKPKYWFSAHLHCKFSAYIPNDDDPKHAGTRFLALDKCLAKRRFLQILNVEPSKAAATTTTTNDKIELSYDLEWLSILQSTNHLINAKSTVNYMPGPGSPYRWNFRPTANELSTIQRKFENNNLRIPKNFVRTVKAYNKSTGDSKYNAQQTKAQLNPQTVQFCNQLDIDDPLCLAMLLSGHNLDKSNLNISLECNSSGFDSTFNTSSEMTPMKEQQPRKSLSLPRPLDDQQKDSNPDVLSLSDDETDAKIVDDSKNSNIDLNTTTTTDLNTSSLLQSTISSSFGPFNDGNADDDDDADNSAEKCRNKMSSTNISSSGSCELKRESPKRSNDVEQCNDSGVQVKKFKRRNQSIYATTNDDGE